MQSAFKRAFTLMEVNLAIFIMAVGALTLVSLYPFGFKETDQSREDVAAAATADAILNQAVAVLSATNYPWSKWKELGGSSHRYPVDGWREYIGVGRSRQNSLAANAFSQLTSAGGQVGIGTRFPGLEKNKLCSGIVFTRLEDPRRVSISVRVSHLPAMLMAQPIYYTEVYFNGDPDK